MNYSFASPWDVLTKRPPPPKPARGGYRVPISPEVKEKVKRMLHAGLSSLEIGRRTGVSTAAIRRWRTKWNLQVPPQTVVHQKPALKLIAEGCTTKMELRNGLGLTTSAIHHLCLSLHGKGYIRVDKSAVPHKLTIARTGREVLKG